MRQAEAMLEALGNFGDFIGGIAVVATLIYLIRELGVDSVLRAPGTVKWWKRNRGDFQPEFAALIDSYIEVLGRGD